MRAGFPRVIAHRGASVEAPENTMHAFRRAVERGARAIEFDVHLTADGHPVVIHDPVVDRTTDGSGPVKDMTLDEVRALDAGAWFDARFEGSRVPTLDEVFAFVKDADVFANVEIKTDDNPYPGIEDVVAAAAKRHAVLDRLFVSSFDAATVRRFREKHPDVVGTGVIHLGLISTEEAAAHGAYADAIGLYVECVTPETVRAVREAKLEVVAWTVNDAEWADRVLDEGAIAVITDDPGALRHLL